jgi:hypothetical protein
MSRAFHTTKKKSPQCGLRRSVAFPKVFFREPAQDSFVAHAAGLAAGAGGGMFEGAGMAAAGACVAAPCAARRAVDMTLGVLDEHIAGEGVRGFSVGHTTSLT